MVWTRCVRPQGLREEPELSTPNETAFELLHPGMHDAMRRYCGLVEQVAGGNLAGLTVFGAVLSPGFDAAVMSAASVVVLNEIDLRLVRRLGEEGPKLGGMGIGAPLMMTPGYIVASLDTFPLEMLEIYQRHATLSGKDYFADLSFKDTDMRLQCEREFKRLLIQLRQGLLTAAGRDDVLAQVGTAIGSDLLRALRGLLWLKGEKQPQPRDAVIQAAERLTGGSLSGVRHASQPHGERGWEMFESLYNDVARLAKVADEL